MIHSVNPFPTSEYIAIEIKDWDRKKKRLLELMDRTPLVQNNDHSTSYPNAAKSQHLFEVGDILDEEFKVFSKHVKHEKFVMSVWFQSYGPRQLHAIHNHSPGCNYASIIYLCHDPKFHYPTQYVQENPFSGQLETWSNQASTEGYWYLWSAGMYHYTLPCDHPDAPTRKIMSMNLEFIND